MKPWTYLPLMVLLICPKLNAQDYEGPSKAFASAYVQEQIKEQLANYLNQHPQIVMSANPNIGTQSLKVVGKIVAAYGFATARNDKDRAFAALQFMAPDPTTATILFAIQLGDALLELQLQKDLAKTYEEIARIDADTVKVLSALYLESFARQMSLINRFATCLDKIDMLKNQLKSNGLYKLAIGDISANADEIAVTEAVKLIFELQDEVGRLPGLIEQIEVTVNFRALQMSEETLTQWKAVVNEYGQFEVGLVKTREAFLQIFKIAAAKEIHLKIDEKAGYSRDIGRLYLECVKKLNHWSTSNYLKINYDEDYEFLESCKIRFGLDWRIL